MVARQIASSSKRQGAASIWTRPPIVSGCSNHCTNLRVGVRQITQDFFCSEGHQARRAAAAWRSSEMCEYGRRLRSERMRSRKPRRSGKNSKATDGSMLGYMGLDCKNLDKRTRTLMLAEIERDIAANTLYGSENLSQQGQTDYPELFRVAAASGNDVTLAAAILPRLNSDEKPRLLKSGGPSQPPVMPINAHEMLAEREFNRFYICGVCLRAIEDGISEVIVYRAKAVENPRQSSQEKIGQRVPVDALLRDLRMHIGIETALGLPPGPNSGLSVRLP